MFKKMKTVDGIVSQFRRTVDQLRDHAAAHADGISQRFALMSQLAAENNEAQKEQGRAISIANRIEEIIG